MIKTINIKGKEYAPVSERVKEFHIQYPSGQIHTEIVSDDGKRIVLKATVIIPAMITKTDGYESTLPERRFTGYSQAEWGKGMMGSVALEVAETSAVGRALGFANIGLLDGIATADEVRKNTTKQSREELEATDPFID